jgi:hypothetical protein
LSTLRDVTFSSESGLLIITTAVGILCQYDESAYAYKLVNGRWQRVWESEQNDYASAKFLLGTQWPFTFWQSFRGGHEEGPAETYAMGSIARDRTNRTAPVDVLIEFTEGSIDAKGPQSRGYSALLNRRRPGAA